MRLFIIARKNEKEFVSGMVVYEKKETKYVEYRQITSIVNVSAQNFLTVKEFIKFVQGKTSPSFTMEETTIKKFIEYLKFITDSKQIWISKKSDRTELFPFCLGISKLTNYVGSTIG